MIVIRAFNNRETARREYNNAKRANLYALLLAPGTDGWNLHLIDEEAEQQSGKYLVIASDKDPLEN